ncbi:MAG: carboxypeptidase regulatory-like domain-containing protein, partial [Candidatus Cloacimonetes bacterium]|nr:carboxypeptidase regulatory-like domain-containing protein [Candidatus Cloacimonadota bacterium]
VYAGTYNVTASKTGYQSFTQDGVVITGLQTTTVDFVLTEITLPPAAVVAVEAGDNINLTWMAPGTAGGEWLHYDSGENNDSIGTGGSTNFDVAVRFPPSALTDYAGMSLHALKVWPAQPGTFTLKVWTGGDASTPGTLVVEQPFTPVLDTYNTVLLDNPVTISGTEELWFGYNCNVSSGYPAGCDAGPATDGLGNMMYFNNVWGTLLDINPDLNYNWNIQGYVGYTGPDRGGLMPLTTKTNFEQVNEERALDGYKVWRLLQGQESNEAQWAAISNIITTTAYQDTDWSTLPDGMYRWAVKAVYTGGALSATAFSNVIERLTEIGTISGFVRDQQQQPISGATVSTGNYSATTNAQGVYSMAVPAGTHSVVASHPNYTSVVTNGVIVVTNQITTLNFILPPSEVLFEDSFESYADFSTTFAPWILNDVDGYTTYGFSGISFPNSGTAMSFIVFNPATTTPPLEDNPAHTGDKYVACFASTTAPNNDWMITPVLPGGGELKFWARTYMPDYGLERIKVGVSTTGTAPEDFTIISEGTYLEVPIEWTEYTFDLASYYGQQIHIALNCVSNDAFILFVDDVEYSGSGDADDVVAVHKNALNGNYPNPFNPETTISFSVMNDGPVNIDIYNVKGQLVRTLVKDVKAAGDHTVVWKGTDNNGRAVSSGVYYYKMTTGKYSSTKKMILMK